MLVYDAASSPAPPPAWTGDLVADVVSITGRKFETVVAKLEEADVTNQISIFVTGLNVSPT
jgi:hypothetical protein